MNSSQLAPGWDELAEAGPGSDQERTFQEYLDHGAAMLEQAAAEAEEKIRAHCPADAGTSPKNMMNQPEFQAVVTRLRSY